jgi:hypothetical protein
MDPLTSARFYRRWILANGFAEAVGLGSTFVLGGYLAPRLDAIPSTTASIVTFALAVALGTVLEGIVVGAAQEHVLGRQIPRLRQGRWLTATAVGAGVAWAFGMMPSTIAALVRADIAMTPPAEPQGVVKFAAAAALGLFAGPILGFAQWVVLRKHVEHAGRWLWANASAWAVGMPLIFAGMDVVPWSGHPVAVALAISAVCGATGLAVGAIHGRVLVRML